MKDLIIFFIIGTIVISGFIVAYANKDNGGSIKNGMLCTYTMDWCTNCRLKPLIKPPQSWCYVEVVK